MSDDLEYAPASIVRLVRERAGLSQRALAEAALTAQSVVARIESEDTSPTWDTLQRLARAGGFEIAAQLVPLVEPETHMLADVARILSLTPEDRLREVANISRFVSAAVRR